MWQVQGWAGAAVYGAGWSWSLGSGARIRARVWSRGKWSRKAGGASVRPELVRRGTGVPEERMHVASPGLGRGWAGAAVCMERAGGGVWAAERELGLVSRYMNTPAATRVAASYSSRGLQQEQWLHKQEHHQKQKSASAAVSLEIARVPSTPACNRAHA